jgi:hypothetical protein
VSNSLTLPDLHLLGSNGTFSAWIKLNEAQCNFNDAAHGADAAFGFREGSSNHLSLYYVGGGSSQWMGEIAGTSGGNEIRTTCTQASDINTWNHYALTWTSSGALAFYRNGQLLASDAANTLTFNPGLMSYFLGYEGWGSANFLKGTMDEVALHNRVLTQSEIQQSMNGTVCVPPTNGALPGDVNGDGRVDVLDLIFITNQFGRSPYLAAADANTDGAVNLFDVMVVVRHWGRTY